MQRDLARVPALGQSELWKLVSGIVLADPAESGASAVAKRFGAREGIEVRIAGARAGPRQRGSLAPPEAPGGVVKRPPSSLDDLPHNAAAVGLPSTGRRLAEEGHSPLSPGLSLSAHRAPSGVGGYGGGVSRADEQAGDLVFRQEGGGVFGGVLTSVAQELIDAPVTAP